MLNLEETEYKTCGFCNRYNHLGLPDIPDSILLVGKDSDGVRNKGAELMCPACVNEFVVEATKLKLLGKLNEV